MKLSAKEAKYRIKIIQECHYKKAQQRQLDDLKIRLNTTYEYLYQIHCVCKKTIYSIKNVLSNVTYVFKEVCNSFKEVCNSFKEAYNASNDFFELVNNQKENKGD